LTTEQPERRENVRLCLGDPIPKGFASLLAQSIIADRSDVTARPGHSHVLGRPPSVSAEGVKDHLSDSRTAG